MRAIPYAVLSWWLFAVLSSVVHAQQAIPWAHDIQQAYQAARQQEKLVLVHFWSPDCIPCRKLERYVFPNPQVARAITANYIPVKVNAQQRPDLVQRYGIHGWPTDILLTADGREVHRGTSPQDARQYVATIDRVATNLRSGPQRPWDQLAQAARDSRVNFQQTQYTPGNAQFQPPSYGGVDNGYGQYQPSPASGGPPANPYGQPAVPSTAPTNPPYANPYIGNGTSTGQPTVAGNQLYQGGSNQPVTPSGRENEYRPSPYGGAGQTVTNPHLGATPGTNNQYFGGDGRQPVTQPGQNSAVNNAAQQPSSGSPYQPQIPRGNPPLAMDGFCPVTMFEQTKWKRGDVRFGAIHRSRTYLFGGPAEQQRFLADPDRYSPALSGFDSVRFADTGELINGNRRHGVFYRNQIFLFADEAALQRFSKSPHTYSATAFQAMRQNALGQSRR